MPGLFFLSGRLSQLTSRVLSNKKINKVWLDFYYKERLRNFQSAYPKEIGQNRKFYFLNNIIYGAKLCGVWVPKQYIFVNL
jgi:hypothetical protein